MYLLTIHILFLPLSIVQNKNKSKDDPLSSLDNEVSNWIFDNSIRNMLLKHQRTVIIVTQKTYLVHSSDYVNI